MTLNQSLNQDLQYAIEVARGAGKIAMDYFGKVERLTKTHAATTDEAVTEADRATQRFIVASLRKRFPDDGLIGEENDCGDAITNLRGARGERIWVIDPIDGTNNFVAGFPNFAVCIGLLDQGMPVLGRQDLAKLRHDLFRAVFFITGDQDDVLALARAILPFVGDPLLRVGGEGERGEDEGEQGGEDG